MKALILICTLAFCQTSLMAADSSLAPKKIDINASQLKPRANDSMTSTMQDGTKVDVQADGTKTIKSADGSTVTIKPDGSKVIKDEEGSTIEINKDGSKTIKKADGTTINVPAKA